MIGLDANLLVYTHRKDLPQHDAARVVLSQLAAGSALWGMLRGLLLRTRNPLVANGT